MRHRDVRQLLYDYLKTEMDPLLKEEIRHHLADCEACTRDLRAVNTVLGAFNQEVDGAGTAMEQKDWDTLHAIIMQRVQETERESNRFFLAGIGAKLQTTLARPRYALAAGLAVIILGMLWFLRAPVPEADPVPREAVQVPPGGPEELGRYFRKSRALLVGLSNLDPPSDAPVDLSLERELSKQLMIEGRSLRGRNLDQRSNRLIGDLDKIMERVSSTPAMMEPPDIQTIRSDIKGQNLLVKLRVAETSYAGTPHPRQGEGL
jgi:hypothetical protein